MIWNKYLKCRRYVEGQGLVSKANLYWNMYLGNQWYKQGYSGGTNLPVMNYIEPVINYKTSTICEKQRTATFSDADGRAEYNDIYAALNDNFRNAWKKGGYDAKLWRHLKASSIVGDSYLYLYGSDPSQCQLLPNVNVLLGDEMNEDIQEQPYICIRERAFVRSVQQIAQLNGVEGWEDIVPDKDDDYVTVNKDDVLNDGGEGKVTSVIYFEKRNGIVWCGRAIEGLEYEPLHPIDNLHSYPIIGMVWQSKPNSARGQGEVVKMIPNQVEVNKTYARRSVAVSMYSYPIKAYNTTMITNPEDLDKVGVKIGVNGGVESVQNAVSYISPTQISPDAKGLSDDLMHTSRELAGAGDTSMGQIDPTRVSGAAIVAITQQASLTLNEQATKTDKVVEDIANLMFDMWVAYNPNGLKIKRQATDEEKMAAAEMGQTIEFVPDIISADDLKALKPEIAIDVSQTTQWAMADRQTALDNLLTRNMLSMDEYVECLEDDGALPKAKLLKILKRRPQGAMIQNGEMVMPPIEEGTE